MKSVCEYKILESDDREELSDKVNACLKNGWLIHGPLNTVAEQSEHYFGVNFFQAMIKKDKRKNNVTGVYYCCRTPALVTSTRP